MPTVFQSSLLASFLPDWITSFAALDVRVQHVPGPSEEELGVVVVRRSSEGSR